MSDQTSEIKALRSQLAALHGENKLLAQQLQDKEEPGFSKPFKPDTVWIWSHLHKAWWNPAGRGYTQIQSLAGLFDRAQAEGIVEGKVGNEKDMIVEPILILLPKLPVPEVFSLRSPEPETNPCKDILDLLWREIVLARKPAYGDWDYPGMAGRHLLVEIKEIIQEQADDGLVRGRELASSQVKLYEEEPNEKG